MPGRTREHGVESPAPMGAEDEPEGAMLEYYRVDSIRRVARALVIGPSILLLGAILVALSIVVSRYAEAGRWVLGVAGAICTAGGPIYVIFKLHRALREEAYLALRTDGLLYHRGAERELVAWDAIEKVRWDAEAQVLRLERREGEAWVIAE